MEVDTTPVEKDSGDLSLNSLVEVTLSKGRSYGIIRWIGTPPGLTETMAGIELVGLNHGCFIVLFLPFDPG